MENREFNWDWVKHEDGIFTNRSNFFFVAEAMFFSGVAFIMAAGGVSSDVSSSMLPRFLSLTCWAGVIITFFWLLVNMVYTFTTQRTIKNRLKELEPRWRESGKKCFSNHICIGIVLPALYAVFWILLL